MSFDQNENSLYDLLEVGPDATPQDIRAAYLRAKTAYKKDSLALYSLMSESETEELLRRIEQAYVVLSHPDRRKEYDRMHGLIAGGTVEEPIPSPFGRVVSIDRVPPMESGAEDLLIAPNTDFRNDSPPAPVASAQTPGMEVFHEPETTTFPSAPAGSVPTGSISYTPPPRKPASHSLERTGPRTSSEGDPESLSIEIAEQTEWKGSFIRRVRELRGIALEELSSFTKISKTYLGAIEEEDYAKLPAPVYLRGFVSQVAKALRLPQDQVVTAYMERFRASSESEG